MESSSLVRKEKRVRKRESKIERERERVVNHSWFFEVSCSKGGSKKRRKEGREGKGREKERKGVK